MTNTITVPGGVTVEKANRLNAIGAKYVCPAKAGEPAGWQVSYENEAQARSIIAEQPPIPLSIIILGVMEIGYDPGVTYYSITYRVGDSEHTAKLATLRAAADGLMTRGVEISNDAVRLYHAAQAVAEAHYYRPMGNGFRRTNKRVIA